MRDGVVTVVIPVYNVEKYLDRCIKSVVNQTYENLEILLVDDGSPDRCPEMCDEWAKRDSRIKVIHKKNAGLGMARNTGIENAAGEYICFVDSDDYIALRTIEKAFALAKETNADIVSYGYCRVEANELTGKTYIPSTSKNVYKENEILEYVLPNMIAPDTESGEYTNLWMSMCGGLFSAELFLRTNWRMVSEREIISEDVYSLLYLYKHIKSVAVIPEACYFYCENEASLTHTFKKDRFERIKMFYDACISACDELGYSDKIKGRLRYPYLSNTIAAMKMIVISDAGETIKQKTIKAIIGDKHLRQILKHTSLKKEKATRKILLELIQHKQYRMCYLLLNMKAKR